MLNKIQKKILKNGKKRLKPYNSITTYYLIKKHFDVKFYCGDENGMGFKLFNKNKHYGLETVGFANEK